MKKPSFTTRAVKAGGYSVAASAIVLVIVVIINLLVSALPSGFTKIDTSSNRLYTLSEQSANVLASLDKNVNIYWVVRQGNEDDTLELLLNQYASKNDHITLTKIDPDIEPAFIEKYTDSAEDNSLIVESDIRYSVVSYIDIYKTESVADDSSY